MKWGNACEMRAALEMKFMCSCPHAVRRSVLCFFHPNLTACHDNLHKTVIPFLWLDFMILPIFSLEIIGPLNVNWNYRRRNLINCNLNKFIKCNAFWKSESVRNVSIHIGPKKNKKIIKYDINNTQLSNLSVLPVKLITILTLKL